MSRSLKKGPRPKLLKKVEDMNAKGEKKVIRTEFARASSSRRWLDTPLVFMTDAAMCQSM